VTMMKFAVLLLLGSLALVAANCPNSCSGHGTCGTHDKCTCYPNWKGLDCADRLCGYALAFADTPSATDVAHGYAECSGKGLCDRKSGECKCFPGYEGEGCRRATCPNGCSGHGTCEYLEDAAHDTAVQVGGAAGRSYMTPWDAKKYQVCKCDSGYKGVDCSQRLCPIGSDPLMTVAHTSEVQVVGVTDGDEVATPITGYFTLSYTDMFNAVWTTRPIKAIDPKAASDAASLAAEALSATEVKRALESIPNFAITDVTVAAASVAANTASATLVQVHVAYTITFAGQHNRGNQPTLVCDFAGCAVDGCQPYYAGVGGGASPDCRVITTTEGNGGADGTVTVGTFTCSGRGDCDHATGLCLCHSGYTEEDCSVQTVLL
jgi:hypothetical protein